MARSSLRTLSPPTRVAVASLLVLGLAGLALSLHLITRTGPPDLGDCLSPDATRLRICAPPLERAIQTTMRSHIPAARERAILRRWMRQGARMGPYFEGPERILAHRCGACHAGGAQAGVRLETYADALSLATPGGRDPYHRLTHLHVHLFTIGAALVLLAFGLGRTRFAGPWSLVVGLTPLVALLLSVPLTLFACQTAWGPVLLWLCDVLVTVGWLVGSGLVAWDLVAPTPPTPPA